MPNGHRTRSARRREIRKTVPRPGAALLQQIRSRATGQAVLLLLLFAAVASLLAVPHRRALPYHINQVVTEPVTARVAFQAIDEKQTLEARQDAAERSPSVYRTNAKLRTRLLDRFDNLIRVAQLGGLEEIPADAREAMKLTPAAFNALKTFTASDQAMADWETRTREFVRKFFSLAVLDKADYAKEIRRDLGRIRVIQSEPQADGSPRTDIIYPSQWISTDDPQTLQQRLEGYAFWPFPPALRPAIVEAVMSTPGPTCIYDSDATAAAANLAYEQAEPVTDHYRAGDTLVPAGTKLGATHLQLLAAEWTAYRQWLSGGADRRTAEGDPVAPALLAYRELLADVGVVGLMLAIGAGLWIYIFRYYPRVTTNPLRGLAITCLLLLAMGLASAASGLAPSATVAGAALTTIMATMVMAIVYDRRFALFAGSLLAVATCVCLGLKLEDALAILAGVGVTAAILVEVRRRSQLVLVGFYAGLAMAATAALTALVSGPLAVPGGWHLVGSQIGLLIASGFVTGLFVQGVLPLIEKTFRVTTAMTLKELNDAAHPLLQRMAQEAPGTYQHSLRLADITEAAADAIGADGLLCRVGAMYHDIGKINKPSYFIENQGGGPNRHDKLSPAMSLLIIVGHVKDGIEMAREYGLPPQLRHFIESHHGTTLVEYFYHAARKQQAEADQPAPSEFEFRYPGPKPQTREAAIMLLCDGIEAAARTIDEPTPVRLDQLVHSIAMKRLMDGQFDDCSLTLSDLASAETAITRTLCAVYHARVRYPGRDEDTARPGHDDRDISPRARTA